MPTQKKIDTVKDLTKKVGKAKAIVLADYRGLKHKQLEELRKILKKVDAEFAIVKNRLFKLALGQKAKTLQSSLTDATAALLSYNDEVAPIRELLKFFKGAGVGKPKAGILGTQVLSEEEVGRLASLPNRNVLLSNLVSQLNAPIQGLHYALSWNINRLVWGFDAIRKLKSQNANVKATT